MTASRIREVALYYFSQYGYKGTSLSQIAQEVGVKTPSIYAHFKSKEEIFFSCLSYALENDLHYFQEYLHKRENEALGNVLYTLLVDYAKWVSDHPTSMFCLRMLYLPPHYFAEQLIHETNERIFKIAQLLQPLFQEAKARGELKIGIDHAVEAFLCLFDGLIIELLYTGNERFQFRLEAAWQVYLRGVF